MTTRRHETATARDRRLQLADMRGASAIFWALAQQLQARGRDFRVLR